MKYTSKILRVLIVAFLIISGRSVFAQQASNNSPLMGWASWNNFSFNISENIIKGQADALVSSGLSAAGYNYVNIDDGYFKNRNGDGSLGVDGTKFPNGMKTVADYIHSKGLKAGIYTDAGSNTCGNLYNGQTGGGMAGIYKHEQQDANLFLKTWGYDFLKVDYCGGAVQGLDEQTEYRAIKTAINNTGRTYINYNVCRWQFPGTWITTVADSWRIAGDITNTWAAVTRIIDANAYLAAYCSKGHYNDMDMLEVGRGMTAEEDKSHFSMWCIMSSPLMLGNDLRTINTQTKNIVSNAEAIAINQDTTGLQAHIVTDNGNGLQVWAKNLNGMQSLERAVVLFNRTSAPATMSVKWKDLNLVGSATVRDIWAKSNLDTKDSMYSVLVPSHGIVMLKVVGTKAKLQEVFEAEYAWLNNFNMTHNASFVANQGRATVDAACSGGAKTNYVGSRADNYIEFRNVYANATGKYKLTITYQSGENRNATMSINGKDTLLSNLNSGSFTTLKSITINISLKKGNNVIRFSNATGWVPDIDKIQIDLNKNAIVVPMSQSPFNETIHPIPGKIEIEEYDFGGEGVAYHETNTNGNEGGATLRNDEVDIEVCTDTDGGYNLGYTLKGEWVEYTVNVLATGEYDVDVRVAKDGGGGIFHIEMDGVNITNAIAVPNTGGWQVWQTVTVPNIRLTSGEHVMRIAFDSDYTNINYVAFTNDMITTGIGKSMDNTTKIFPNPFNNEGVVVNVEGVFRYRIMNISGAIAESGTVRNGERVGRNLPGGLYILQIENQDAIYTFKIERK